MTTAIVWFRRDLRLADNPALCAALEAHDRVLPVYIHALDEEGDWAPGGASRWWLHHSLDALRRDLQRRHCELHLRQGGSLEALRSLIKNTGATAVYWNRLYDPLTIERDRHLKEALGADGIEAHSSNAGLWFEPWQIVTKQGDPYKVFTPFWRNLRAQLQVHQPLDVPGSLSCATAPGGVELDALQLVPTMDWARGLGEAWQPGEAGAHEMMELFGDDAIDDYDRARNLPDRHGTSRLSPHLHFGEISPRQIQYALHQRFGGSNASRKPDLEPYLRELGWREFSHHLLYYFPKTPTENFNPRFKNFEWAPKNPALIGRWQRGRTGIPLVDAGMRELWHTGWMHNRVRMVVASFLTKNLRQHWHHGERWFWDTLVDADLGNNSLGWQWVAGCGADAAPYFRVFNPVTQSKKFDPEGTYLRRWIPELAEVDKKQIHEPWKHDGLLEKTGYPAPMVGLGESRQEALDAYQAIKG